MLSKKLTNGCVLLVLVCLTNVSLAQNGSGKWPPSFYRPVPPLPPELKFSYDHASTALEGELRGAAQLTHATGNYWLAVSQAFLCREEARRLALSNRVRCVEYRLALQEWREWGRLRRLAERRTANEAARPARYEVYRLSPSQLGFTTGIIAWPNVLLGREYDELRGRLDELFRRDANGSSSANGNVAEVTKCVRSLAKDVRRHRSRMSAVEYLSAQRFLCGVRHEAEFPSRGIGLRTDCTQRKMETWRPNTD